MSDSDLDALLKQLESLSSQGRMRRDLHQLLSHNSESDAKVRQSCALVRWFDKSLYDLLTNKIEGRADFDSFTQSHTLKSMGPRRYALEDSERERLLSEWAELNEDGFRKWNHRLGRYFLGHDGADYELCAIYHLAAAPNPLGAVPYIDEWYREADERFDLAQCSALLEMLNLQRRFRGPRLSAIWRNLSRYFASRMLFSDDYWKTGSYFERRELIQTFRRVLVGKRKRNEPAWIFHIHATGGTGKTMFLRWLMSRYLTPRRIPCARVDFDDFLPLQDLISRPLRLLVRLVEQWSVQVEGLSSLLELLNRAESITGWAPDIIEETKLQLRGAKLEGPLVVSLDTLEGATLTHPDWLRECIGVLRDLRSVIPGLKLILAGRYDIAERCQVLCAGEFVGYEIPRFTEQEAHDYLDMRGIPAGPVRDAIVARAGENEQDATAQVHLAGRNPFKLAMFAEIVLTQEFTVEDIHRLPRVDVAYLLERVIRRIDSQPLRWMVRYGAIARNLTLEFVKCVLMEPLQLALAGTLLDLAGEGLGDNYQDTWQADPPAVYEVKAQSLWDDLKVFARQRGWISVVTINGEQCLRFHPEVLTPVRELLAEQKICADLQVRAAAHFEHESNRAGTSQADWTRNVAEAIYHRFQLQVAKAKDTQPVVDDGWSYWQSQLQRAAQLDVSSTDASPAVAIAKELLRTEYCALLSPAQLCEVHCTIADELLNDAGIEFARGKNGEEFRTHVELAEKLSAEHDGASVPELLKILAAIGPFPRGHDLLPILLPAREASTDVRAQFYYCLLTAQHLAERSSAEVPRYFREALRLLENSPRTGVDATDIWLELEDYYTFKGSHSAVLNSLFEARRHASDKQQRLARVLQREAAYDLAVGDFEAASVSTAELVQLPVQFHSTAASREILQARLALSRSDPLAALDLIDATRQKATADIDVARLLDLEAEANGMLFEFARSLELYEQAGARYDLAGKAAGSARCRLLAIKLLATVMHNYRDAELLLQTAGRLPGFHDMELRSELQMLRAYTARGLGDWKEASSVIEGLLKAQDPEPPPTLRARKLMFAILASADNPDELCAELVDTLWDVQPLTLRDRVLEWAAYFWDPVDVPGHFAVALMSTFAKSRVGSASGVRRCLARADLLRLFRKRDEASVQLAEAERTMVGIGPTHTILNWELNQVRRRLGLATQFNQLAAQTPHGLAPYALFNAIHLQAARETNDYRAPRELLRLSNQPANIFEAERLNLFASRQHASKEDRLAAQQYTERLGLTRLNHGPSEPGHVIRVDDMPNLLQPLADDAKRAVAEMVDNWEGFAQRLSAVIEQLNISAHRETIGLEPETRLAALPWEMASVLQPSTVVHRTSVSGFQVHKKPPRNNELPLVLFAGPIEGITESLEGTSGISIEQFYRGHGVDVLNVRDTYGRLVEIERSQFQQAALIHISCTLRGTTSGTYLDFEETRIRAVSFAAESAGPNRALLDLQLTASHLDRLLTQFARPPFVVLDIAHPFNKTEALRMLLLRNRFAAELFSFGHVRGVLGCGLSLPQDHFHFSSLTVGNLMTKTVGETLVQLRRQELQPDKQLDRMLPTWAAALWTNDPTDRLFPEQRQ